MPVTDSLKRHSKAKLWQINTKHKNPAYWGDKGSVTVNARNVDEAIRKAKKIIERSHEILEVEWIATED